jgi:hypothetical protein
MRRFLVDVGKFLDNYVRPQVASKYFAKKLNKPLPTYDLISLNRYFTLEYYFF